MSDRLACNLFAKQKDLADVITDARAAGKRWLRELAAHLHSLSIPTARGNTADGIRRLLNHGADDAK